MAHNQIFKTLAILSVSIPNYAQAIAVKSSNISLSQLGTPSYIPLPGAPVNIANICGAGKDIPFSQAFPDITSRFTIAKFDAAGGVSYGPIVATAKNQQFKAALDYANTDVVPVKMWIKEVLNGSDASYDVRRTDPNDTAFASMSVPVLVGIGFRVTAEFVALESKVELSGLNVIGAGASASKLRGSLMVEAIGVSGKGMSAAFPLPSKIDPTTIEGAILAIGAGRAAMYDSSTGGAMVTPRIVGMYSPGNNPKLVSMIQAELISDKINWTRPCLP